MYRVDWLIDVDADTAFEAANKALEIQRDSGSVATCFLVTDDDRLGRGGAVSKEEEIAQRLVDALEQLHEELAQAVLLEGELTRVEKGLEPMDDRIANTVRLAAKLGSTAMFMKVSEALGVHQADLARLLVDHHERS